MTAIPTRAPWRKGLSEAQQAELRAILEDDLRRLTGPAPARGTPSVEAIHALEPPDRARGLQLLGALQRLEAGTYGRCTACQAPIPYLRLSAIPETTVCVQCSGVGAGLGRYTIR
ncbi:MAG TPA: TraR/DksA C4-type zinc finger protein [Gemmatimonadales bacterium]|jgi:hypothetical protein|nr:TraR/DksA C4-type zinc finger protein [Gemmatimonadales bacterium]